MDGFYRKIWLLFAAALMSLPAGAQFTAGGTDPTGVKWKYIESRSYRIIYPQELDSLAREYASSLEKYAAVLGPTCGYRPNGMYSRKMPVVLHPYQAYSNGSVAWAPRAVNLYTTPDAYESESTPWIDQLAVHEGRHVAQMQFVRGNTGFRILEGVMGELWAGAASAIWPGPAFFEGDAVVAETALTGGGRGRTADFLEYYRASLGQGLYRNYWQWRYSSQKNYTPDYYRAGYMLAAGMRYSFDEPCFTNTYYSHLVGGLRCPFFNLQKTVRQVSGMKFRDAFQRIEEDFAAVWAENDSLRSPETEGSRVTAEPRRYEQFGSLRPASGGLYAVRSGLDRANELVLLDGNGLPRRVSSFSAMTSRLHSDGDTLFWTEYKPDPRWEMRSTSVLKRFDGKKTTTLSGGRRYYSPCPVDDGIAVAEYLPAGEMGIAVLNRADGSELAFYPAPDGIQPVEIAWLDGQMYVCAIGQGGYGIYRLQGWERILGPAEVKVKGFFAEAGKLWFTCDLSGVNDLYSLDPDSGVMQQETATLYGADNFVFEADTIYFTKADTDDRGVFRMPADSLLARPCRFEPLPRKVADKLSAQEPLRCDPDFEAPTSEPMRYSKLGHLFKLHSWAPVYVDYDAVSSLSLSQTSVPSYLGVSAWFQNDLQSSYGQIGVSLDPFQADANLVPTAHLQWVYTGLYPVFEVKVDYGGRHNRRIGFEQLKDGYGSIHLPSLNMELNDIYWNVGVSSYVPLNFSSGGWKRGIIPMLKLSLDNDRYDNIVFGDRVIESHYTLSRGMKTRASVRGYAMQSIPNSCIFPRWGVGGTLSVTDHPFVRNLYGSSADVGLYGYLPGFMRSHGLRIEGQAGGTVAGQVLRSNYWGVAAEYALPFAPVDWSFLCPVAYIRNFELRLYGSYTAQNTQSLLSGERTGEAEAFVGAALAVHLGNFFWVPFDTLVGIKYLYNPFDSARSGVSLVFNVDI